MHIILRAYIHAAKDRLLIMFLGCGQITSKSMLVFFTCHTDLQSSPNKNPNTKLYAVITICFLPKLAIFIHIVARLGAVSLAA